MMRMVREYICAHRTTLILLLILLLALGACIARYRSIAFYVQQASCNYYNAGHIDKMGCWMDLLDGTLKTEGVAAAIRDFLYLDQRYPDTFDAGACHLASHRLGDMIYFSVYLNDGNFDEIDFPPESSVCTFGIMHGFFMHLFENRPSQAFITDTCRYFSTHFSKTVASISAQCYHGAGHGYVLARAASVPASKYGDFGAFILAPLAQCDDLPDTTDTELYECRQGAFTQVMEWATAGQYGLLFDENDPFSFCNTISAQWKSACYNQFADAFYGQQFDLTIPQLVANTARIADPDMKAIVFWEAVIPIAQRNIDNGSYVSLMAQCADIPADLTEPCVKGFINGIMNAGLSSLEFDKLPALCSSDTAISQGLSGMCFADVAAQLKRYYSGDQLTSYCAQLPDVLRQQCAAPVAQSLPDISVKIEQ